MNSENPDALHPALLNAATSAVEAALRFDQPADVLLGQFFRTHRSGGRDRGVIAEAVFAVLRRLRSLGALAAAVPGGPPQARALTLLALAKGLGLSQRRLAGALRRGEAEWLAKVLAARPDIDDPAVRLDMPDWIFERLRRQADNDEIAALCNGLNTTAPLDLRVNVMKGARDAVLRTLQGEGLPATACPLAPHGIRLQGRPAVNRHPLYESGAIEVQDEGSQLLGLLLAPRRGELVVDFCAGAGGKTLLFGAMMRSTGRLHAFDVSAARLDKLGPRAARAGLSNVHPMVIDGSNDVRVKRLTGKADRVFVDAPCSGLGTLRRNPDLKWRQSPQSVAELTAKQAVILAAAARLVKPGGRLVYATCSILEEENAGVVDAFLAAHPGFVRLSAPELLAGHDIVVAGGPDLRLTPHRDGTDGFYAAVLERSA